LTKLPLHSLNHTLARFPRPSTLLWCLGVLHALLAVGMGLSVDEAHYLLYAAHPALSYFDHPPLVGWVQWPLVVWDAPTVVLRLVPGLVWLATVWAAYRLTLRLQGGAAQAESAGLWALLALALAPLLHVLGIGLLPDTLLMLFTVLLMHQTWNLLDEQAVQRPIPWLVLGLLLGLAGLSKYTAVLAAVAVAFCLLAVHGLRLLRNPWLWVSTGLALAMVAPVAVWNAQNQWVSFTYQAEHGAGNAWQSIHVLRFLLVQVLVYGPLLLWGVLGWRRVVTPRVLLLLSFPMVFFAVLAALSGGGTSLPHWSAPAWVALAPFAGLGLAHSVHQGGMRWVVRALVALQALACAALLGMMVSAGQPFIHGDSAAVARTTNPFADLHGWEAAGQTARKLADEHQLSSVAVQNWTLASRLGWYARPLPVHVLQDRFDQFDLWAGDLTVGADTLLVDWSQMPYTVPRAPHGFAECSLLESQSVQRFGVDIASFRFYACHGWSGDPRPQLKLPA
jgi:hypothetical protein